MWTSTYIVALLALSSSSFGKYSNELSNPINENNNTQFGSDLDISGPIIELSTVPTLFHICNSPTTCKGKGLTGDISRDIKIYFHQLASRVANLTFTIRDSSLPNSTIRRRREATATLSCETGKSTFEELEEDIRDLIEDIASLVFISCDESTASFSCDHMLRRFKCVLWYLQKSIFNAISNGFSLQAMEAISYMYNSFEDKGMTLLKEMKTSATKKEAKDIVMIQSSIPRLGKTLKTAVEGMKNLSNYFVKMCVLELSNGRVASSVAIFNSSGDDVLISQIIEKSYSHYGGMENLNNILGFIKKLPTCKQEDIAATTLLEIIIKNLDEDSYGMLSFSATLRDNCSESQTSRKDDIHHYALLALKSMVENVQNGNGQAVYQFAKDNPKAFRKYAGTIVKEAYNNLYYGATILDYIHGIPYTVDEIISYAALFDKIKTSFGFRGKEIVTLAFRASKLAENADSTLKNEVQLLEHIRLELPTGIKSLLYDQYVHIKSSKNQSLCLGVLSNTVRLCPCTMPDFNTAWSVQNVENGKYFRFEIEEPNSYFSYEHKYLSNDQSIVMINGSSTGYSLDWHVIAGENGTDFMLVNRFADQAIASGASECGKLEFVGIRWLFFEYSDEETWWKIV